MENNKNKLKKEKPYENNKKENPNCNFSYLS